MRPLLKLATLAAALLAPAFATAQSLQLTSIYDITPGDDLYSAIETLQDVGFTFPKDSSGEIKVNGVRAGALEGEPELKRSIEGKMGAVDVRLDAMRLPDADDWNVYSIARRESFERAEIRPLVEDIMAQAYARAGLEEASCKREDRAFKLHVFLMDETGTQVPEADTARNLACRGNLERAGPSISTAMAFAAKTYISDVKRLDFFVIELVDGKMAETQIAIFTGEYEGPVPSAPTEEQTAPALGDF